MCECLNAWKHDFLDEKKSRNEPTQLCPRQLMFYLYVCVCVCVCVRVCVCARVSMYVCLCVNW
jgi:hypothetical protein